MTRKHITRKGLLWAIPLALAAIAVILIVALPGFVSSRYHRGTIEALASSLTGRDVHIKGNLSLAILPQPQLIADGITITGPDHETITAKSLTLDIAPGALLRGRLSARSITLQSPRIALPWPLPGGAAAVAPPPWLTTLHAQVSDGQISLGAITFTHVAADIFTGGDGALSVAGTGDLSGTPIYLSLGAGALSAAGSTQVTLAIQSEDATKLHALISGTFDASSTLTGNTNVAAASLAPFFPPLGPALNLWLTQPLTASTAITAGPRQISLSNLDILQGGGSLTGTATLNLAQPMLSLIFTAANLSLPADPEILRSLAAGFARLPTHIELAATSTTLLGTANPATAGAKISIPQLQATLDLDATGANIRSLEASFPGNTGLSLSGAIDPAGELQAQTRFDSAALPEFFAALDSSLVLPATWQAASITATLGGNANSLQLNHLSGTLGPSHLTGAAVFAQPDGLAGALHFDTLDLTPFANALSSPPANLPANGILATDFEITADHATIGKIPLTHLLLDASVGGQLVVRRLSASAYGGLAAGSFTLSVNGPATAQKNAQITQITSARAIFSFPSAQPLALLLPANLQPPTALTMVPLALSVLAAGPANALATSATLALGDINITAGPTLDLAQHTAAGPFTLRHPDAIAAFKAFGLKSGLPWPGAGSISLRADMLLGPDQIGFPNFVLSMGDLTANGKIILSTTHPPEKSPQYTIQGQIDADTFALPPIPANFTLPWGQLANLQGQLDISANTVQFAGNPVLGPTAASILLSPNKFDLTVAHATLGNGALKGEFSATAASAPVSAVSTPANPRPPAIAAITPPSIAANFALTGADTSKLSLPMAFPLTLPAGIIDATANLTATGYAPETWLATLTGTASLSAKSGSISGFNLPALSSALTATSQRSSRLHDACQTGATPFTTLALAGNFANGIYTITTASLAGPAGTTTAAGAIDLPNTGVTLTLALVPNVPAPPKLNVTIAGSWTAPRKITALKPALAWKPPAKPSKASP